jgi:hypothetical protein
VTTVTRRTGPKLWLFRLLTLAFGFAVALALAEVTLRVAGWSAPGLYVAGRGPVALRTPGRDGGAFPPSVKGELRHYDYDVEFDTNSFGFRDSEIVPKQSGEWRIGILGDSFTAGMGVKQQERFADIFAAEMKARRSNVTVWNLGAPLCGTACEAAMLDRVRGAYQIDEIVLAFYGGNDVEDNSSWYANIADPNASGDQRPVTLKAREWLREHSRVSTFVWVNAVRAWASFKPPGIYSQIELDKSWPDTERSLEQLKLIVGSKKLVILYLPAVPEWNDEVWQELRQRYGVVDNGRAVIRKAVANWARNYNVRFIDATEWLRKCESLAACVFPVDPHWNARGHRLVAEGLLRSIGTEQQQ